MSNIPLSIGRYERGIAFPWPEDDMRLEWLVRELGIRTVIYWSTPRRRGLGSAYASFAGQGVGPAPIPIGERCLAIIGAMSTTEGLERCAASVSVGSYLVVEQTLLDHAKVGTDGPYAALGKWLPKHPEFVVDEEIEDIFQVTMNPYGWLRRIT